MLEPAAESLVMPVEAEAAPEIREPDEPEPEVGLPEYGYSSV